MKNRGVQITIALMCMILSLMLTVQFKSVKTNSEKNLDQVRSDVMQTKLSDLTAKLQDRDRKLKEYEDAVLKNDETSQVLKKDMERLKIVSGLIPVKGTGIIVTLNDNKLANTEAGQAEDAYIVHDKDILMLVNELKAIGAEAISINEQRLVSTTEIRCIGPAIMVNGFKTAVPFEIKAIGNPDALQNSLEMPGGIIESYLKPWVQVDIKKQSNITIPKFDRIFSFKYAQPIIEEAAGQ